MFRVLISAPNSEADGDIKRSRKGRYKSGGPVLNIVFSNGVRASDVDGTVNNVISTSTSTSISTPF